MTDWIEWKGGECPLSEDTFIEVELRSGERNQGCCQHYEWQHGRERYGPDDDIIAYRVVQS